MEIEVSDEGPILPRAQLGSTYWYLIYDLLMTPDFVYEQLPPL